MIPLRFNENVDAARYLVVEHAFDAEVVGERRAEGFEQPFRVIRVEAGVVIRRSDAKRLSELYARNSYVGAPDFEPGGAMVLYDPEGVGGIGMVDVAADRR